MTGSGSHSQLDPDTERWSGRLVTLLAQQLELYGRLDVLSRRQSALIDEGDTEGVLAVLESRQELIERLAVVQEQIQPFQDRWPEVLGLLSETQRTEVEKWVDRIGESMSAIMQRDEHDRVRLDERRNAVGSQLGGVARGRGALRAYGAGESSKPRYQDRSA